MTELVRTTSLIEVNEADFGLTFIEANEIAEKYSQVIESMLELVEEYDQVVKLDYTIKENSKAFKDLKNKFVKVRTLSAKIHKEQKAYYLAGGKYVDSWKNKQIEVSERYEKDLDEKAKYFETLELQRKELLRIERAEKVKEFAEFMPSLDFADLSDDEFETVCFGAKAKYDANLKALEEIKKQEEQKAIIEKRIITLERNGFVFNDDDTYSLNLSMYKVSDDDDYSKMCVIDAIDVSFGSEFEELLNKSIAEKNRIISEFNTYNENIKKINKEKEKELEAAKKQQEELKKIMEAKEKKDKEEIARIEKEKEKIAKDFSELQNRITESPIKDNSLENVLYVLEKRLAKWKIPIHILEDISKEINSIYR